MSFYEYFYDADGAEHLLTDTVYMAVDRIEYERLSIGSQFEIRYYQNSNLVAVGRCGFDTVESLVADGWHQRSIGVRGQALTTYSPLIVEVPVYTTEPDRDVPAMFVDERKL